MGTALIVQGAMRTHVSTLQASGSCRSIYTATFGISTANSDDESHLAEP